MVAYSFQPEFVDPILSGRKCQTIRAVARRRHAVQGDSLQLYTGMRTKKCRLIGTAFCASVKPITLYLPDPRRASFDAVKIADMPLRSSWSKLDRFAKKDGFRDWRELRSFWREHHDNCERFDGLLITWRAFKAMR